MKNRFLRVGGALSMLWSLVVLGAPAPLSDCAMAPAGTAAGMHMAMGHHGGMSRDKSGNDPSAPDHHAPNRANCCSPACCCGSLAPLPELPALPTSRVAVAAQRQPLISEQTVPVRAPHSLPFAHAPPLS